MRCEAGGEAAGNGDEQGGVEQFRAAPGKECLPRMAQRARLITAMVITPTAPAIQRC